MEDIKEDLIKLKDLLERIIIKSDLSKIDINSFNGTLEIHSSSSDVFFNYTTSITGDTEEFKRRIGIDTEITLAKGNLVISTSLENLIKECGGEIE